MRSQSIQECLTNDGWQTQLTWDGGIRAGYPQERASAYQETFAKCSDQAKSAFPLPSFNAEAIRIAYRAEIDNRTCIVNQNYLIPEAPSEQEYIDTFFSNRWEAHSSLEQRLPTGHKGEAEYVRVLTICWPPSWSE